MSQDETDNILSAFDRHASRRSVLRGLVAMGAGGVAFGQFAEALAQATSDEVAQLTILSQPGVVPEILKDVTLPLEMYNYSEFSLDPTIAAISTVLLIITSIAILIIEKLVGLGKQFS